MMPKAMFSMISGVLVADNRLGGAAGSPNLLAEVGVPDRHGEERDRYGDECGVFHRRLPTAAAYAGKVRGCRRLSCEFMKAILASRAQCA